MGGGDSRKQMKNQCRCDTLTYPPNFITGVGCQEGSVPWWRRRRLGYLPTDWLSWPRPGARWGGEEMGTNDGFKKENNNSQ